MVNDFWVRAQHGELEYWKRDSTGSRAAERTEERAAVNRGYVATVRRHGSLKPGDRVLEVGCGPAGAITVVDDRCERYGVDSLIHEYRDMYGLAPAVRYSKQVGERLAFKDAFFHVVMCINVLDHTRNPSAVLDELCRVLCSGGMMLLVVDTFRGLRFYRKRFKRWLRIVRGRPEKHPHTFRAGDITRAVGLRGLACLEEGFSGPSRRPRMLLVLQKQGL